MPHIIVKLWPGQTSEAKQKLSDEILGAVTNVLGSSEQSVSIGFEEIQPDAWMDKVYEPDIARRWDHLTKKPGYGPRPDR